MIRKIANASVAVVALVALLSTAAFAQDRTKLEEDLEGVQGGYMRMYTIEPGATPVTADGSGTHTVMVMAYRFDSDDNASAALDTYAGDGMDQFFEEDTGTEDLADLGDKAVKVTGTTRVGDTSDPTVAVLVQEGTDVYLVIAMGGDEALGDQVIELTTALIDQDVPDTKIVLDANGGSTGSVFDIMPGPEDHEMLSGLVPVMDMDLMLETQPATPAS